MCSAHYFPHLETNIVQNHSTHTHTAPPHPPAFFCGFIWGWGGGVGMDRCLVIEVSIMILISNLVELNISSENLMKQPHIG